MIYFIGAGPGAADLITVRGKELLEKADLIIYAGSLVNPALLEYAKPECTIMNSAVMTLEEVIAAMVPAAQEGKLVVRLHTGDPSVYGAHREQMDLLKSYNLDFEVVPGVSSFCAAAAALNLRSEPWSSMRCLPLRAPQSFFRPSSEMAELHFIW